MVKFGSYAQVEFILSDYTNKQALLNRINVRNIRRLDDETNIAGGLKLMRENVFTKSGDRDDVKNIGMKLTFSIYNLHVLAPFMKFIMIFSVKR